MRLRMIPCTALSLISAILVGGCASGPVGSSKESILPTDLKPMSEIYREHFGKGRAGGNGADSRPQTMTLPHRHDDGAGHLQGPLSHAALELDATFPRLSNPTLVMYVYPHLAGPSAAPVPGYATRFRLYVRDEYAMTGEDMEHTEDTGQ